MLMEWEQAGAGGAATDAGQRGGAHLARRRGEAQHGRAVRLYFKAQKWLSHLLGLVLPSTIVLKKVVILPQESNYTAAIDLFFIKIN